jgi:hypothetical protein
MRYVPLLFLLVLLLTCSALAQSSSEASTDALQKQITELRQQLAQTKLTLDKTVAELATIRKFLAQDDRDKQLAEWRKERRALEDERRRASAERRKLEEARQMLHRTTARQAVEQARQAEQQATEDAARRKPRWSVQYMIGLIDKEDEQIYLRVVNGRVVRLRRFANIDTSNVMVRGTFVNTSTQAWRYTFVIRIAGDANFGLPVEQPGLNGQWRYQTPVLGPGDLHEFAVKVPVKNVYDIDTVRIGDITADLPATTNTPQTDTP